MAQAASEPASPGTTPSTPAGGDPAHAHRVSLPTRKELLERALSLREGSIIIVTLLAAIYFSVTTRSFLTSANFKTLLPFFAPFAILAAGEVFVMILGEIDLSIGAIYLFAPFLFYKLGVAGIPHVPCVLLALVVLHGGRPDQRLLHGDRRHQLVRGDARRCCSRSRG